MPLKAVLQMPSLLAYSEPTQHFWVLIPVFKEKEIDWLRFDHVSMLVESTVSRANHVFFSHSETMESES